MTIRWWVWQDGPDYLAYDHRYPCDGAIGSYGGASLVSGEPMLTALTRGEIFEKLSPKDVVFIESAGR